MTEPWFDGLPERSPLRVSGPGTPGSAPTLLDAPTIPLTLPRWESTASGPSGRGRLLGGLAGALALLALGGGALAATVGQGAPPPRTVADPVPALLLPPAAPPAASPTVLAAPTTDPTTAGPVPTTRRSRRVTPEAVLPPGPAAPGPAAGRPPAPGPAPARGARAGGAPTRGRGTGPSGRPRLPSADDDEEAAEGTRRRPLSPTGPLRRTAPPEDPGRRSA